MDDKTTARAYDLTKPEEIDRWFEEMHGYLSNKCCNGFDFVDAGTDVEGRRFAWGAMSKIKEAIREAALADVKALLERLKQDTTKPSYANSIKLQSYNEVLEEAISQLSNLQGKPHCETCNAEGYKGKDGKFIHTSMQQAEPDEICANCNQWIYLDMEGDWVHRKPAQKHGDWRLCEDGRAATPEFNDKKV